MDDLAQEVFLRVYRARKRYVAGAKFSTWLYTIATNQAIDAQRRNKRHKSVSLDRNTRPEGSDDVRTLMDLLESREPTPESRLDAAHSRDWVREAVDALPDGLREAVNLVYYQGLKYREAADILDIPVGTVKSRLHAAILKLNAAWMDRHPNSDFE